LARGRHANESAERGINLSMIQPNDE